MTCSEPRDGRVPPRQRSEGELRPGLRALPAPPRAALAAGRNDVGRRAADGGHGAGADGAAEAAADGRAVHGARPDPRRRTSRSSSRCTSRASPSSSSSRTRTSRSRSPTAATSSRPAGSCWKALRQFASARIRPTWLAWPGMDESWQRAVALRREVARVAVATVVATRRSAPRPVGCEALRRDGGELEGSVSGGWCVSDVVLAAQEVLAGGPPRLLTYGITNEMAFGIRLPCGGEIDVLVRGAHRGRTAGRDTDGGRGRRSR